MEGTQPRSADANVGVPLEVIAGCLAANRDSTGSVAAARVALDVAEHAGLRGDRHRRFLAEAGVLRDPLVVGAYR